MKGITLTPQGAHYLLIIGLFLISCTPNDIVQDTPKLSTPLPLSPSPATLTSNHDNLDMAKIYQTQAAVRATEHATIPSSPFPNYTDDGYPLHLKALEDLIILQLSQGAKLLDLQQLLNASTREVNIVSDIQGMDLNADGQDEILVVATLHSIRLVHRQGAIIIATEESGSYQLYAFYPSVPEVHWIERFTVEDLTNSGTPELVYQYEGGYLFCEGGVIVIGWDGSTWNSLLMEELVCPTEISIHNIDDDQEMEITFVGYSYNAARTHEPVREEEALTQTYDWNGTSYNLIK